MMSPEKYKEYIEKQKELNDDYLDLVFDTLYFRYEQVVNEMLDYKGHMERMMPEEKRRERNRYMGRYYQTLQRFIKAPHKTMEAFYGTDTKVE